MKSISIPVAFLVVLLAALSHAWGPATHYYMTCEGLKESSYAGCFAKTEIMAGTEMPDAFFFGGFVTGSPCVMFQELHSLLYGGYLVRQAESEGKYSQLAMGYGAHVAGDAAGFYPGGYLGTGNESGKELDNWISLWPFMTAVDAEISNRVINATIPTNLTELDSEQAAFMKRARDAMAADFPAETPNITATEIQQCSTYWNQVVTTEVLKASAMPTDSFGWEMVYNDVYGATTMKEARQHREMATGCGIKSVEAWHAAITNTSNTPVMAYSATVTALTALIEEGKCNPMGGTDGFQMRRINRKTVRDAFE